MGRKANSGLVAVGGSFDVLMDVMSSNGGLDKYTTAG